jgi:1-deoxy-D-xylulose-5-phosphate synthase
MKICAPSDENELSDMIHTMAKLDDGPSAVRYPRGTGYGDVEIAEERTYLEPGKGRIVREGKDGTVAILSIGSRLREALKAASTLEAMGISATVADARWVKPLDEDLVIKLAKNHKALITVEENAIGGFSAVVQQTLFEAGVFDGTGGQKGPVLRSMIIPDRFIEHDTQEKQYDDCKLNAQHIVSKVQEALSRAGISTEAKRGSEESRHRQIQS